jgi:hypothetical protein
MPQYNVALHNNIKQAIYILMLLTCFYLLYWLVISNYLQHRVDALIYNAAEHNILFVSGTPKVKGFPLPPGIEYSGEVNIDGTPVVIPDFRLGGMFIPGTVVTADFPQGFAFRPPGFKRGLGIENAFLKITMPSRLPHALSVEELKPWQELVTKIDIKELYLQSEDIVIKAKGYVGLDPALQPIAELKTEISGYRTLLTRITEEGFISKKEASIATLAMDGMAKEHLVTGLKTVEIEIAISDQSLFLGPLRVARLPQILWDTRKSPDRPLRLPDGLRVLK